tara:strand:- start:1166 stop:2662 length:1497 start_codon:yes stop_codon:yes gene_type:complete
MIFHLIKIIFLSVIFSTRFFDQNQDITLGNNRSCAERPSLDNTLISPSGNFLIHYNDYYEGITDFANQVAIAADSSQRYIVDIMNFRNHIPDSDILYDIYIKQLPNGSYGWNCPDGNDGASWVVIDDDYIGANYSTSGLDAMKISIAHEYFHAIQRAYVPVPGQNSFFYELSSIWIEDLIYPDINDYIFFSQYGDDYFSNPERNMNSYNGYGLGLYGHYLNEIYDNQIMQRIWEEYSFISQNGNLDNESVFDAIDSVLDNDVFNYNSTFVDTWLDFNSKNLFNGNQNSEFHYYSDQFSFNPISTNPVQIDTIQSISRTLNNRSVKINSFYPYDISIIYIQNNSTSNNVKGNICILPENNSINNIGNSFQTDIISSNDVVNTVYISDLNSNESEILLSSTFLDLNFSENIYIYPNPTDEEGNLTLRFNSGIKSENILLKLYNLNGQLLKNVNLGSINYTTDDYNIKTVNLFNKNFPSGIYILSFHIENKIVNKKVTLLK